jgi:hypothetical protein
MLETLRIFTTVLVVVALPAAGLAALLVVIKRIERAREARIARQVALTDAIHRELGAVVAPVVTRGSGRGWRVGIAVPLEQPTLVARVVAIAHAAMLRDCLSKVEIVLTPQLSHPRSISTAGRSRAGISPLAASEREAIVWTGTSTSRAS